MLPAESVAEVKDTNLSPDMRIEDLLERGIEVDEKEEETGGRGERLFPRIRFCEVVGSCPGYGIDSDSPKQHEERSTKTVSAKSWGRGSFRGLNSVS